MCTNILSVCIIVPIVVIVQIVTLRHSDTNSSNAERNEEG